MFLRADLNASQHVSIMHTINIDQFLNATMLMMGINMLPTQLISGFCIFTVYFYGEHSLIRRAYICLSHQNQVPLRISFASRVMGITSSRLMYLTSNLRLSAAKCRRPKAIFCR